MEIYGYIPIDWCEIHNLTQNCDYSSALTMELLQSFTKQTEYGAQHIK